MRLETRAYWEIPWKHWSLILFFVCLFFLAWKLFLKNLITHFFSVELGSCITQMSTQDCPKLNPVYHRKFDGKVVVLLLESFRWRVYGERQNWSRDHCFSVLTLPPFAIVYKIDRFFVHKHITIPFEAFLRLFEILRQSIKANLTFGVCSKRESKMSNYYSDQNSGATVAGILTMDVPPEYRGKHFNTTPTLNSPLFPGGGGRGF